MDGNPLDWLPDSPCKSPAWRLRARWLYEKGKRIEPPLDDDGVQRIQRFLDAAETAEASRVSSNAERTDPALAEAIQLYCNQPLDIRWRLEAYLLTGEPLKVVAARTSLHLTTVQAYHDAFFDVRPHREARDWIWQRAIGAWNSVGQAYPGTLWKAFAYTAGPLALELAIAVTTDSPFPQWVRDSFTDHPAYEEARLRLLGRLAIAALRTNSPTELEALVDAREQLRSLDHQVLNIGGRATGLLPALENLLKSGRRHKNGHHTLTGKESKFRKRAPGPSRNGKAEGRATVGSLLEALQ